MAKASIATTIPIGCTKHHWHLQLKVDVACLDLSFQTLYITFLKFSQICADDRGLLVTNVTSFRNIRPMVIPLHYLRLSIAF